MSRSGYVDDYDGDNPSCLLWPSIVKRSMNGKRGQAFLRELLATLEALPEKRLIAHELQTADGAVCAIGSVGKSRGLDMSKIDPEDSDTVAATFGISPTLAREIVFTNDDDFSFHKGETPEQRYVRVLEWVRASIVAPPSAQ